MPLMFLDYTRKDLGSMLWATGKWNDLMQLLHAVEWPEISIINNAIPVTMTLNHHLIDDWFACDFSKQ